MNANDARAGRRFAQALVEQQEMRLKGGIYHLTQTAFAYNSNRIEGSLLSEEQTRYLLDTRWVVGDALLDDVIEMSNHFRALDLVLAHAGQPITAETIKSYHRVLIAGTAAAHDGLIVPGEWKSRPNTAGGARTAPPHEVGHAIADLIRRTPARMSLDDIIDWHVEFETVHPFQDGNGRVGRLLAFEQCLANDVVPFIVLNANKAEYFDGLARYIATPEVLHASIRAAQSAYRARCERFLPPPRTER